MKLIILGVIVAAVGCNGKQSQCTDLIAAYNEVGTVVRQGVGDGTDPAVAEANAKAIEDTTKKFAAVEVSDAELATARDDLAKAFGSYVAFLRTLAGAVRDAQDPAKADAATRTIEGAQAQTQQIMTAIETGKQAVMTQCNATAQ